MVIAGVVKPSPCCGRSAGPASALCLTVSVVHDSPRMFLMDKFMPVVFMLRALRPPRQDHVHSCMLDAWCQVAVVADAAGMPRRSQHSSLLPAQQRETATTFIGDVCSSEHPNTASRRADLCSPATLPEAVRTPRAKSRFLQSQCG